jgi:hypothetical protein
MLRGQFKAELSQIRNLAKLSKDLRTKFGEFGQLVRYKSAQSHRVYGLQRHQ